MDADNGSKVGLTCTMGEDGDEEVLLCTLREGATESQSLDLVFDHYTEFKVQGSAAVHLTGYYMPEYEEGVCLPLLRLAPLCCLHSAFSDRLLATWALLFSTESSVLHHLAAEQSWLRECGFGFSEETSTDEEEDEEDDEELLMDLSPEEAAALEQYQRSSRFPSKIKFEEASDDEVCAPPSAA